MKKVFVLFIAVLIICVDYTIVSAADVTGLWNMDGTPDAVVIICQDQNKILLVEHQAVNGQPAAAISYAQGIIEGNKINFAFKVVRRSNSAIGGASGVTHQDLVLSADGKVITGTYKNDTGQGTASTLRRVY